MIRVLLTFTIILLMFNIFSYAQNVGQKDGDTVIVNYTDIQGNRQGKWVRKYDEKRIAYEAYFKNNILIGDYKRYYKSGVLMVYIKYNKTGSVGYAKLYWDNKKVMAEGKYIKQNVKDSLWKYYDEEGLITSEEMYNAGVKDGVSKDYFKNGKTSEIMTIKNGKKNGIWKRFFESGGVRFETKHVLDKREGPFNVYYEDGKPYMLGHYKNDIPDGKWTIYNKNGSVEKVLEYINGKLVDQEKYDEEFKKEMKSWEQMKGKIPEPKESDFFKSGTRNDN
jgi:antitoxin component YwqK of YwqJK toxin-antitoxin module